MPSRLGAVLLVMVALVAGAGCGGDDGGASAAELVRQSADSTGKVQSFRFALDVANVPTGGAGLQLTGAEGDVAVPDRASADVTGTFSGVPISTQVIAVGDDVWLKLFGKWQKVDVSTTPAVLLSPSQGVLAAMSAVTEAVDEGTEDLDGTTVVRVSGTAPAGDVAPLVAVSPSDPGRQVPVTLWIGEDDTILRRIEVRGPIAEGETDDAVRTVDLSRFGEPVTVEPPEDSE
jgi:hypothetical protein